MISRMTCQKHKILPMTFQLWNMTRPLGALYRLKSSGFSWRCNLLWGDRWFWEGVIYFEEIDDFDECTLLSPKITSPFFFILGDRFEVQKFIFKFFRVDTKVLDRSAKSNFWFNWVLGFKWWKDRFRQLSFVLQEAS